jgi:hypothetical protein
MFTTKNVNGRRDEVSSRRKAGLLRLTAGGLKGLGAKS